jgi:hypothetical protein
MVKPILGFSSLMPLPELKVRSMRLLLIVVCGTTVCGISIRDVYAQPIVVNDNVIFRSLAMNALELSVEKTVDDNTGGTSAWFFDNRIQQTISGGAMSADEGSDWYLVQPGELFSRATIAAGQFPIVSSLRSGAFETVNVGPDDFYLGVRTGVGYDYLHDRDAYGWVHLGRTESGELTMLENVMSYNNYGIYVGTTEIIPEPSSAALAAIGATLLVRVRRQR